MPEQNFTNEQKARMMHFSEMARLLRILKEKYGEEVYKVIEEQNGERVYQKWREIAEQKESNTIADLIKLLWEQEGFVYSMEVTETGVQMKCTGCWLYDMAKYLGIMEEVYYMFCTNDPYIVEGFNENMGMTRTKTLMQGDDCCNHFYYLKKKDI